MLLAFFLFTPVYAVAPAGTFYGTSDNTALTPTKAHRSENLPPRTIVREENVYRALAYRIASQEGVSGDMVVNVIDCESEFDPDAIGDHGKSYGLAQIYMPVWESEVSKSEALDPEFAITFMARQMKAGNASLWSCYRKLYGT